MGLKTLTIYKYHIHTATEEEVENLSKEIRFVCFNNRIENEMLGVKWITPIGENEDIAVEDIRWVDYLGKQEIELNTEIGSV